MFIFEGTGIFNLLVGILTFVIAWQVINQFPNIDMLSPSFISLVGSRTSVFITFLEYNYEIKLSLS